MVGNPKDSAWRHCPRGARNRPKVELSLSLEAHERLEALAKRCGSKSAAVEMLILKFSGAVLA